MPAPPALETPPQNRPQVMVIKHGALGDMVQAFDAFASVRAGHEGAHLVLLTTPPFLALARAMPFFDEVVLDPRAQPWDLRAAFSLRRLFRRGWERIYDFQASGRTRAYFRFLVPSSVAFIGVHGGGIEGVAGLSNRDRLLRVAESGGCGAVASDTSWLGGGAFRGSLSGGVPYAVLVPGCSAAKPEKRWPAERFAETAGMLLARGVVPYVVGTEVDRDAVEAIKKAQPQVIDCLGRTSLFDLASLFRGADLVVGNDTGPVFLAAWLGVPTVMVMSCHTDPVQSAPVGQRAFWLRDVDIVRITPRMVLAAAGLSEG